MRRTSQVTKQVSDINLICTCICNLDWDCFSVMMIRTRSAHPIVSHYADGSMLPGEHLRYKVR